MGRPKGTKNKNIVPLKERLYSKAIINKNSGCWEMQPFKGHRYPKIQIENRCERANRISYEITFGKIPSGVHCLHKCDNTKCINPEHLFLGTHQENMHDKIKKGRAKYDGPKGTRCAQHKLQDYEVKEILDLLNKNHTQISISRKYGICQQTISKIKTNQTWLHIFRG